MSEVRRQRGDNVNASQTALLPVLAYAERYPRVPICLIVECLLESWRDASPTYVDDDWMASFDRLATARLTELAKVKPMAPDSLRG